MSQFSIHYDLPQKDFSQREVRLKKIFLVSFLLTDPPLGVDYTETINRSEKKVNVPNQNSLGSASRRVST
jgi:hypothetical protein